MIGEKESESALLAKSNMRKKKTRNWKLLCSKALVLLKHKYNISVFKIKRKELRI